MQKFTLILLAFVLYSHAAIAQWSADPSVADTRVIVKNSTQREPHIVTDGNSGSIVFWIDENSGTNIYYNRLNSSGVTVWANTSTGVALTDNSAYNDINQVISDDNGGAFIIWEGDGLIWVQHIDNTGAKVLPFNYLISDGGDGFLCSDGEGGFIIAWSSYNFGDDEYQTYAQRIDVDGNPAWYEAGNDGIRAIAGAGSRKPMGIVTDGDGGAIIIMEDARNSDYDEDEGWYDNMDIFAQRINRYGITEWGMGGMPVTTAPGNQSRYGTQPSYTDYESYGQGQQHPSVVSDGAGGAIIAWEDYRNDPNNGNTELDNEGDIYCQRLNENGLSQWDINGKVLCEDNGDQYAVSLMPNGNGGAVVAWVDRRYNSPYIYAQNITMSGSIQWGYDGQGVSNEIDGVYYTISPNVSNSALLITWATLDFSGYGIRAQKIDIASGALNWGSVGVVVCSNEEALAEPVITYAGSSSAIIAWRDERNLGGTNLDIYANLVVDGALPVSLTTFDAQAKNGNVLVQWTTSSEQNTAHFEIEHGIDGTGFSKIGNVKVAGNSASSKNYTFTDQDAVNGANFYRLKIVDTDGKFAYSKTVNVTFQAKSIVQIFPNPARDVLNLQISGGNGNGIVQIFDLSGKKVKEQSVDFNGNSRVTIDISNLPKGIFNLIFKYKEKTEQLKFVKQ